MNNKAIKTIQRNVAQIIEIIIVIISIIVILVGIKTMVNASEVDNSTIEETMPTDSSFKPITPLIMSTEEAIEETPTPEVKESEIPTETPIKTPSIEPSIIPSVMPSNEASKKPKETATPSAETEQEEYISEDDLIYSEIYLVKDKVISKVDIETTIEEFMENIEIANGVAAKIYKGEKEVREGYIGTGMRVVGSNGQENEISVRGDLTGERKMHSSRINDDYKRPSKITGLEVNRSKRNSSRCNTRWSNRFSRYK